jgi:hypothetical protein
LANIINTEAITKAMKIINLVSPEYQAAYLMATKKAALTGDDVYEVHTNTHTAFSTGESLQKVLENERISGIKLVQSYTKII